MGDGQDADRYSIQPKTELTAYFHPANHEEDGGSYVAGMRSRLAFAFARILAFFLAFRISLF